MRGAVKEPTELRVRIARFTLAQHKACARFIPIRHPYMHQAYSIYPTVRSLSVLVLLAFGLLACTNDNLPRTALWVFKGPIMGTHYTISVVVPTLHDVGRAELDQSLIEVLHQTNQLLSHYLADSDLAQLNQAPSHQAVAVPPALASILGISQTISQLSDGAFDVTLAPAIDAWGFGPAGQITTQPSELELRQLRARVGYQNYTVLDRSVTKLAEGLTFNLSAIGKGFAVDQVSEYLRAQGFANHLVEIGGELRAAGKSLEGDAWRIGIETPHVSGGVSEVISLSDRAMATSGDYRNFVDLEGVRYSHTISSHTLKPVLHRLASITIVHANATMADGLATAVLALGEQRGIEFARNQNLSFYAMVRELDGTVATIISDDLRPLLHYNAPPEA